MFPNNLKSILLLCIAITIVLGQNCEEMNATEVNET